MAQPHNKKLGEYPMTTRGREQGPEKRYRRLRFPAFTAAKWTTANPLLQRGELGVETDTRKIKVGDGITYWNDLEYAKASGDWGDITGDITEQTDLVEFVNNAVAAEASIRAQADQQLQSNIDNVAANLTEHEQDTNNPHNVTKAQVGLGDVDNTSDADKPVSTAQATAINNAVSTHNVSETAHSNQFSQYRTSASQDTIDNQIKSDIANLQSTKADKATTLAGYGITDAYTKTEVDAKVSSVYRFRGSVATYADLPTTGQVGGDVWNVEDTGANYAWSGTEWDKLSETVDLTPYLTKTEASSTYATQSALAEVSTVAETAQQTANAAGTTAAQALAGLDSKQDKLGFATATTAGIVRVGSGSQMVVNASTGDISLDGSKAESIRDTIGAVATNQGTPNAGKVLGIGDDGNVVPVDGASGASGTGRNIGDIFWTTRTDSALNGAVEANGAQYNFADVNGGDNNVQALLTSGALPSVSIAKFDAMVAEQGGCDSFGYDAPKTWYAWKVDGSEALGYTEKAEPSIGDKIYNESFTEVGTIANVSGDTIKQSGAKPLTYTRYTEGDILPTNPTYFKVPKKVGRVLVLRPMVQLFNGATDDAVATCTQVLQQIANIQQTLNGMDYPIYWDSGDATDHSHAKPGVSTPTNHGWYRYYKSGWVEQGGIIANLTETMARVVFPIIMADVNYTILAGQYVDNPKSHYCYVRRDIDVNGFSIKASAETVTAAYWQVSGMAA